MKDGPADVSARITTERERRNIMTLAEIAASDDTFIVGTLTEEDREKYSRTMLQMDDP